MVLLLFVFHLFYPFCCSVSGWDGSRKQHHKVRSVKWMMMWWHFLKVLCLWYLWRVLTVWWHPTAPCASSGKCTGQPNHRIRGVKGLSDHRAHAPDSECCHSCSSTCQISNRDHNWSQLRGQRELDALLLHFVLFWFWNLVFSMVQKDFLLCASGWKDKPNTWVWLLCCPDWWWVWVKAIHFFQLSLRVSHDGH